MRFVDGNKYKIKLLKDLVDCHGLPYGKEGDTIEVTHSGYYGNSVLFAMEGFKYGTKFTLGEDYELIKED